VIITLFCRNLSAQDFYNEGVALGIGGVYNFKTEGTAPAVRLTFPLLGRIYASPRFAYFPSFNKVHEYYAGIDIQSHFYLSETLIPYIFAGACYNNWINSNKFNNKLAQKNNIVAEGGLGLIFSLGCINPFAEYRYDAKWEEGSVEIGILLRFGSCFGGGHGWHAVCPAYE
jgi:hypothetical protein